MSGIIETVAKRFGIIVWPSMLFILYTICCHCIQWFNLTYQFHIILIESISPTVLRHSNNQWRNHPYVTTTFSSAMPGIQYGFAAGMCYTVYQLIE